MTNDLYRLITRAAFTIIHLSGKSGRTFLIVCQYLKEKKTPYLFDMKSSCVRHLNLMTLAEYGGCCSFLITADANMHSNFDILIEEKYLTDSICVDEFGFYWSRLEDNGVRPIPGFEICGKKEDELDIFRDIQYGNSIDEETIKNIEKYDPDIEI